MKGELIFEDLSVSKIVEETTNKITKNIIEKLNGEDGKYHLMRVKNSVIRYLVKNIELYFDDKLLFSKINKISVEISFFKSKDELIQSASNMAFGGDDFLDEGVIEIKSYGIGGKVDEENLRGILSHELKHAYQSSLYDIGAQAILIKATNIIEDGNTQNSGFKAISELLYYFSKSEIDANVESLNQELNTVKPKKLSEFMSQTLNELRLHKELYDECKIYAADENTCNELYECYGKKFNELSKYIENGIIYFDEKIRKVFARYQLSKRMEESIKRRYLGFFVR